MSEPHYDALLAELRDAKAEIARHHRDFERWEEMAERASLRAEAYRAALEAVIEILARRTVESAGE